MKSAPMLAIISVILLGSFLTLRPMQYSTASPLVSDWNKGWSGENAQLLDSVSRTPDSEETLRWTWKPSAPGSTALSNIGRSWPVAPIDGDLVAFWIRADRPIEKLQAVLLDADEVGAEQSVPKLLNGGALLANRWQYVAWPVKTNPGWVRYARGQVDWTRVKGASFYTWPEQLQDEVTIEIGPLQALTYADIENRASRHPTEINRALAWYVPTGDRPDMMVTRYHQKRAAARRALLREKYPPQVFVREREAIRKRVAQTYLMPPNAGAMPQATPYGGGEIDGIRIERQLLKIRPGVYSPAVIFHPVVAHGRSPAILMLPGHGDPSWAPGVQVRCLSFARRGYLVMLVQPFGQEQRGEEALWNEYHDQSATAFLLTAGQGQVGLIVSDHMAEVTYLQSRPDVNKDRIGVTGVSMGGTHSLWLAAVDPRVKAAVAVAAAHTYQPNLSYRHMGLCDLMPGVYNYADQEMLESLSAPRGLMHLYPDSETPLTVEGWQKYAEGWLNLEDASKQYTLTGSQLAELHGYTHDVYRQLNAAGGYAHPVVQGPHDYTPAMCGVAADWFDKYLGGAEPASVSRPAEALWDKSLSTKENLKTARAMLNLWPDGKRPADMLTPSQYTERELKALVGKIPAAPKTTAQWNARRKSLRAEVEGRLGVQLDSPGLKWKAAGQAVDDNALIHKLLVIPEADIELPMLLFEPKDRPNGKLVMLLDPRGMMTVADSSERRALTQNGSWVLCADLRGMGETHSLPESGGYLGYRDHYDFSMSSLKLGETLAGYWTKDLLAALRAAQAVIKGRTKQPVKIEVRGELECGLIAILAAMRDPQISAVETRGLLSSYYSKEGYGLPFAYADESGDKGVRNRKTGGYGSIVPVIPGLLRTADIPQLAALIAPRPLTIREAQNAAGRTLTAGQANGAFAWTKAVYELYKGEKELRF